MARIKGIHFEKEIVELVTSWYHEKKLSCRKLETMMKERGLNIDHATINRWVKKFEPKPSTENPEPVTPVQWAMQESYVKIRGQFQYLYVFFNGDDEVIDFFVSKEENRRAAQDFYHKSYPLAVARTEQAPALEALSLISSQN